MKIGICGMGIVGQTIYDFYKNKGIEVIGYDKYKKINKLDDIIISEIIFLTLPTNYDEQTGLYNISEIEEICEKLKDYEGIIVLKSTVIPGTTRELKEKYKIKNIIHNPEFISEKTREYDYENQKQIVIGKEKDQNISELMNLYDIYHINSEISICTLEESEMMKMTVNTFYAVKIQYFTEIYIHCKKMGIEYERVRELCIKNGWINEMHTKVPGTDNKISFGGKCLPKDSRVMKNIIPCNELLKGMIQERDKMRDD